jgi:hypothetical protein
VGDAVVADGLRDRLANAPEEVDVMVAVQVARREAEVAQARELRLDLAAHVPHAPDRREEEEGPKAEEAPGAVGGAGDRARERMALREVQVEADARGAPGDRGAAFRVGGVDDERDLPDVAACDGALDPLIRRRIKPQIIRAQGNY